MSPSEIQTGKTYKGRGTPRFVIWVSHDRGRVQYDSEAVSMGRLYPTVEMERFAKWAQSEIAAQ